MRLRVAQQGLRVWKQIPNRARYRRRLAARRPLRLRNRRLEAVQDQRRLAAVAAAAALRWLELQMAQQPSRRGPLLDWRPAGRGCAGHPEPLGLGLHPRVGSAPVRRPPERDAEGGGALLNVHVASDDATRRDLARAEPAAHLLRPLELVACRLADWVLAEHALAHHEARYDHARAGQRARAREPAERGVLHEGEGAGGARGHKLSTCLDTHE